MIRIEKMLSLKALSNAIQFSVKVEHVKFLAHIILENAWSQSINVNFISTSHDLCYLLILFLRNDESHYIIWDWMKPQTSFHVDSAQVRNVWREEGVSDELVIVFINLRGIQYMKLR